MKLGNAAPTHNTTTVLLVPKGRMSRSILVHYLLFPGYLLDCYKMVRFGFSKSERLGMHYLSKNNYSKKYYIFIHYYMHFPKHLRFKKLKR